MAARAVRAVSRALVVVMVVVSAARAEVLGPLQEVLPPFLLDHLEELVQAASAACELLPLELAEARGAGAEAPPALVEYRAGGARAVSAARAARALRGAAGVPVYVPGWHNSPADGAARALVGALLRHHRAVLVLDTRAAFARAYPAAAARVPLVARQLLALAEALAAAGVAPARLHVLGFSLGAHAAGAAGRLVRARLGAPLGRITALDPARPCFARAARRLRAGDAAHVQAVHSGAGVLGLAAPVGHADVYVNGVRRRQPGCGARDIECDHNAAWRVFAASVRSGRPLAARRCRSWRELARAACAGPPLPLAYPWPAAARGMFLYNTGNITHPLDL